MKICTYSWVQGSDQFVDGASAYACSRNGCTEPLYNKGITNSLPGFGTLYTLERKMIELTQQWVKIKQNNEKRFVAMDEIVYLVFRITKQFLQHKRNCSKHPLSFHMFNFNKNLKAEELIHNFLVLNCRAVENWAYYNNDIKNSKSIYFQQKIHKSLEAVLEIVSLKLRITKQSLQHKVSYSMFNFNKNHKEEEPNLYIYSIELQRETKMEKILSLVMSCAMTLTQCL